MDKTIQELEQELKIKKIKEAERKRRERMNKEDEFRKENKLNIYSSDDYAGLVTEHYSFYFGYEETACPKHKNKDCEDLYDCELREWCFVANVGGKEVMRIRASELWFEYKDVLEYLLLGIGKFLENQVKN